MEDNEITPQSNYVVILSDGWCYWEPRYELSVSHCPVDVTWFPIDEQSCDLVFEAWLLRAKTLKLNATNDSVNLTKVPQPVGWLLVGTCCSAEQFNYVYAVASHTTQTFLVRLS